MKLMRNRYTWFLTLVVTFATVGGCGRKPVPQGLPEPLADSASEGAAGQRTPGSSAIQPIVPSVNLVAKVNGEGITQEEFDTLYQLILSKQDRRLTVDERFKIRLNVLNDLIIARIITQKAMEADLPVAATEIELALDQVRENFYFNENDFLASLAARGMTLEQFRKSTEREIKSSKFQDMIMNRYEFNPTEEDLRDWYEAHKDAYQRPPLVQVSHILVELPRDANQTQVQKAKQQAESIQEEILNLGVDFAAAAEKYSDDVDSATGGGLLGFMPPGMMVRPFEEAAFALRVGELSAPVRTYRGWHIIKVNARVPAKAMTYEEALETGQLRRDYEANRRATYFSDWLRNERTRTEVEILDPSIVVLSQGR